MSSTRLEEKPSLPELLYYTYTNRGIKKEVHIIDAIASEWKKLGIALNFESAKLSAIEKSRFYQVKDCCLEMLSQWLEGSTCDHGKPVTWKTLLQAMMEARCSLSVAVKVWRALSDEDLPTAISKNKHSRRRKRKAQTAKRPFSIIVALFMLLVSLILFPRYQELFDDSLPDSLKQYKKYLHNIYNSHAYSIYSNPSEILAANRPKQPLNLALINPEQKAHNEFHFPQEEFVKYAYHGDVDKIQELANKMKIEEIGSTYQGTPAHFVLIEGAPGIGKSTLCWQVCRLWSEDKLRHKWDLMVLVEIRDETTRKARTVYDLLYHPDDSVRKSIAQEVEKRDGEGLVLVFDGYDELSDDQRNELSVFQKILTNRILHKVTVVVTSRPTATKNLPHQFQQNLEQHIVIVGLNETDIQRYISLACVNNTRLLENLRSYVSSQPFVFSVMHNPLHCAIVIELYIQYWQDRWKNFAPNTLTELYMAFLLNLLRRNLPPNQSSDIEELSDLPTHVHDSLMQLAELAARGLKERKYIYDKVPNDTLSLMVSVRQLYDIRPKRSAYMFLHLTLQEYLAAVYWSHQSRYRLIVDLFLLQLVFNPIVFYGDDPENAIPDQWSFFIFLAGLTKVEYFPMEVMIDDAHEMVAFMDCQLLFEAQASQLVSKLYAYKRIVIPFDSLSTFLFSIGYCIANSDNTTSWYLPLYLHNLHMLVKGLQFSLNDLDSHVKQGPSAVNLSITGFSTMFSDSILSMYPFTNEIVIRGYLNAKDNQMVYLLQDLRYDFQLAADFNLSKYISSLSEQSLVRIELNYSSVFDILRVDQALATTEVELSTISKVAADSNTCASMQKNLPKVVGKSSYLYLYNTSINHECTSELILLLTSLKHLLISNFSISIDDWSRLTTAIATTSELKQLIIAHVDISNVAMGKSLARLLAQAKTLEEVNLLEFRIDCSVDTLLREAMKLSRIKKIVAVKMICVNSNGIAITRAYTK